MAPEGSFAAGAATNVAKEWDGASKKSCKLEEPEDGDRPLPLDAEDGIGLITRRPACVPWGTARMEAVMYDAV